MSGIRVFVSFDVDHDRELCEALCEQSRSHGFSVSSRSEPASATDAWYERVRRQIRDADQVIVICGEHTEASPNVAAELRIAQEEKTPYFLLWGRREIMCTKPMGARPADGMYGWTREILQDQIAITTRSARSQSMAESLRSPRKA